VTNAVATVLENLTAKQALWCMEYLANGLNATQAAIAAGYSTKVARQQGAENLSNPVIMQALAKLQKPRIEKANAGADRVLAELVAIGFSDLSSAFDDDGQLLRIKDMPPVLRAAIASVEVSDEGLGDGARVTKIKLWDKCQALDKLAKHLGLLKEAAVNINLTQFVMRMPDKAKTVEEWEERTTKALPPPQ
jgi:phage terminase small subunit